MRQAALTLEDDNMVFEHVDMGDVHLGPVRDEFRPTGRVGVGRGNDAEALRILIRAYIEQARAMVDIVLVPGLARQKHTEGRFGSAGG